MTDPFRLIHSADLHLGRRFGNLPESLRGRLIEARHQILPRLAAAARDHGARDILLAGDTFDTETPSDQVWKQALAAMAEAGDLRWWLLPGNHDSLGAESLWTRIAAQGHPNLTPITTAAPIALAPGAVLLPAPLPRRRPGRDLTGWMAEAPTPEGALRIGLAHGAVHSFHEDAEPEAVIAPDRATLAGLDYLALGDWHGQKVITPRTAYAGTPEANGFTHTGRGACLAVTLRTGAEPVLAPVETGHFHWAAADLELTPTLDPGPALDGMLPPPGAERRNHLIRLRVTGRATIAAQLALAEAHQALEPEFALFDLDAARLDTEIDAADLESLDHGGALRLAAEALAGQAEDLALDEAARRVAAGALNRLHAYLREAP